jgi:two-component system, NarL family, response regulator
MTNQPSPIRILIADDHDVVLAGLAAMLEIDPEANLQVVGQAKNCHEMVELFAQLQPDIGLVDLEMPKNDLEEEKEMIGVEGIKQIRLQFPEARLIILSAFNYNGYIRRGFQEGVKSYLLKDTPREELVQCIQAVYAGQKYITPYVAEVLTESLPKLSDRELEVLKLVAEGKSNSEIGTKLNITVGGVKAHLHNIFMELGVRNRMEAVIVARTLGLI